ncbi:unnamed protein product [Diamesa hyperborea]
MFMLSLFGASGETIGNYERELSTIKLLFYPSLQYDDDVVEITDEWIDDGNFDVEKPVKILIHGWNADAEHMAMQPVKIAYLRKNTTNVLVVDWKEIAVLRYIVARSLIVAIAEKISRKLFRFMGETKMKPDQIHIIGHSLGAHISGQIGRYFHGAIGRITGLDSAGPLFTPLSLDALHKSNAIFIDVIHTAGGVSGEIERRGHADFYPNSGRAPQPGCEKLDLITVTACSHYRAPLLYAESIFIPDSFYAAQCELSLVELPTYLNCMDYSNAVFMGETVDQKSRGAFYLETYNLFPYGKGI